MRLTIKHFLLLLNFWEDGSSLLSKTLEKFDYNCTALSRFLTRLITLSYVIWVDENSMRDLN